MILKKKDISRIFLGVSQEESDEIIEYLNQVIQ